MCYCSVFAKCIVEHVGAWCYFLPCLSFYVDSFLYMQFILNMAMSCTSVISSHRSPTFPTIFLCFINHLLCPNFVAARCVVSSPSPESSCIGICDDFSLHLQSKYLGCLFLDKTPPANFLLQKGGFCCSKWVLSSSPSATTTRVCCVSRGVQGEWNRSHASQVWSQFPCKVHWHVFPLSLQLPFLSNFSSTKWSSYLHQDHQSSFSRKFSIEEESWDVKKQLPLGSWTPLFYFFMGCDLSNGDKKSSCNQENNNNKRG